MQDYQVRDHYDATVGSGKGVNPLCHLRLEAQAGRDTVDIHLCMRRDQVWDRDARRSLRDAARHYLQPHFQEGEGMRCWLAVKNDPRINLWLRRDGGGLAVRLSNGKIESLLTHWCVMAGVSLR